MVLSWPCDWGREVKFVIKHTLWVVKGAALYLKSNLLQMICHLCLSFFHGFLSLGVLLQKIISFASIEDDDSFARF